MSAQLRTAERIQLWHSRKQVLDEIDRLRQELKGEIDVDVEEADEQITEHETATVLIAILQHKVHDIDSALAAIALGRYELCEKCGKPIEQKRLAAKPDARLCFFCQQEVEQLEV